MIYLQFIVRNNRDMNFVWPSFPSGPRFLNGPKKIAVEGSLCT